MSAIPVEIKLPNGGFAQEKFRSGAQIGQVEAKIREMYQLKGGGMKESGIACYANDIFSSDGIYTFGVEDG